MLILNFSHPLTEEQLTRLQEITGEESLPVLSVPVQFDNETAFSVQIEATLAGLPLNATSWQTAKLLLVLPGHSTIAATLLAALHGRCGYFPACARLRPKPDTAPVRFEIAEVVNLQAVREDARGTRTG